MARLHSVIAGNELYPLEQCHDEELHEDSDILPGFQKMNTLAPIGQHSFMGQTLLGKHALHGQL